MNKNWKIGLGILALVVAFGIGFFAGKVSVWYKMRQFYICHAMRQAPHCCGHHHFHHHGFHRRPHHRMCPPAPRGAYGECPTAQKRFCAKAPQGKFGEPRQHGQHERAPKHHNRRMHSRAPEIEGFKKR